MAVGACAASWSRPGSAEVAAMLRLPFFTYLQPTLLSEALHMKADAGPDGSYVAGGTDLYPNMKRRHQTPATVISLMHVKDLAGWGMRDGGCVIGSCVTLTEMSHNPTMRQSFAAVATAGELVSTPLLRNMGTLGGNLCLDTRCNYHNDGINYLTKQADEILADVRLPAPDGWDAVYHKLRRRGSFDFPVLGVAAWIQWNGKNVADARLVLGGVASHPQEVPEVKAALAGRPLSDESIAAAAEAAYRPSKPMDNTDFDLSWRKQMTRVYVTRVLEELRQRHSS